MTKGLEPQTNPRLAPGDLQERNFNPRSAPPRQILPQLFIGAFRGRERYRLLQQILPQLVHGIGVSVQFLINELNRVYSTKSSR